MIISKDGRIVFVILFCLAWLEVKIISMRAAAHPPDN